MTRKIKCEDTSRFIFLPLITESCYFMRNLSTLFPAAEGLVINDNVLFFFFPLQTVLMLLEKDERRHMTHLFEHLSATESTEFTKNDVQNLANKYI